jgi:hypothetical protein
MGLFPVPRRDGGALERGGRSRPGAELAPLDPADGPSRPVFLLFGLFSLAEARYRRIDERIGDSITPG